MKKVFFIEGLDCANCAAAVERNVGKLPEVSSASVNFLTTKMVLEVEEEHYSETLEKIKKIVKKVEPDAVFKEA